MEEEARGGRALHLPEGDSSRVGERVRAL